VRDDARVVLLQVERVGDVGAERDRLARLDVVGRGRERELARRLADEPAQHLPPEGLVRLVLERHVGVHLPEP
jgi:hypothetical protein